MRNERGSVVLTLALVLAVMSLIIYIDASNRTAKVSERAKKAQGMNYAHQIASSLARKIRRAYDLAQIYNQPGNATLCPGGPVNIGNGVQLCLVDGKICTVHPANLNQDICLTHPTHLVAQRPQPTRNFLAIQIWLNQALASPYSPPPPNAVETSNILSGAPRCEGASCVVQCSVNADCISFQFCPLISGDCNPDEFVTQTIGLLRDGP